MAQSSLKASAETDALVLLESFRMWLILNWISVKLLNFLSEIFFIEIRFLSDFYVFLSSHNFSLFFLLLQNCFVSMFG